MLKTKKSIHNAFVTAQDRTHYINRKLFY